MMRDAALKGASSERPGVRALLAGWLAARARRQATVQRIGLCAAQGAGKSTVCAEVQADLAARGIRVAVLALDDFYLPRAERLALAHRVHPLLATRGAPGTHDAALLAATLDALQAARDGIAVAWPRFDKATDDRTGEHHHWQGRPDLVLLEGWCVGLPAQPPALLAEPVNALERDEDADARWRTFVNGTLAGAYAAVWRRFDARAALLAPGFEVVSHWRAEQERAIATRDGPGRLRDARAMQRFLAHYERLTRWSFEALAGEADFVAWLDEQRRVLRWRAKGEAMSATPRTPGA